MILVLICLGIIGWVFSLLVYIAKANHEDIKRHLEDIKRDLEDYD